MALYLSEDPSDPRYQSAMAKAQQQALDALSVGRQNGGQERVEDIIGKLEQAFKSNKSIYLSDSDLAAFEQQAQKENRARPRSLTADGVVARDGVTASQSDDATSMRSVTETERPMAVALTQDSQPREAISPVISGIIANETDMGRIDRRVDRLRTDLDISLKESMDATPGRDPEEAKKLALKRQAIDAVIGVSDKGDSIAASRLLDLIERNASTLEIDSALKHLQAAKMAEDKSITYRTRRGKTVTVSYIDDGDPTTEDVSWEVSGGDDMEMSSGGVSSGRRRGGRRAMTAAATTLGALATSESILPALSQMISPATNVGSLNPFSLSSPQTPAQEIQELGLYRGV